MRPAVLGREAFAQAWRTVSTIILMLVVCLPAITGRAATLDNVNSWVGTGSSRAGLVIDWNDGKTPQSLLWGFRWDGTATGHDMLVAVVEADSRLHRVFGGGGSGTVYGLGYDMDGDGFEYVAGLGDTGHALDADDHYKEGWLTAGYWAYYLSADGATWALSGVGCSSRMLANGDWDGWSWSPAPTWKGGIPDEPVPAPVPELASIVPFVLGGAAVTMWSERRSRARKGPA